MQSHLPVIALIGRPNVGKSTLFNRLTRSRDALVADRPGLTRDRQYGFGRVGPRPYIVVDTGGLVEGNEGVEAMMRAQSLQALAEADLALCLVDARSGPCAGDEVVAALLRRAGRPLQLVVNKAEGLNAGLAGSEFYALGLGEPMAISAAHGDGLAALMNAVLARVPEADAAALPEDGVRVAVVGRPNVGKSTLINRLLGEERVLAFDQPGTTRDSVAIPFERDGKRYTLIDTAGVRRRSRIDDTIEKFSVIKTMQAMEQAHVVIAMGDARQGVGNQDARLLGLAADSGRALVIAVNKWDGLDAYARDEVRRSLDLRLPFLDYARMHLISALHGTGVGDLMTSVDEAYAAANADLSTPKLTRVLERAVAAHAPPAVHGRRIKLRYAHQGGRNPPQIVIHGNQTRHLTPDYHRYLQNRFREAFKLFGTPIELLFRTSENPFEGRKNTLTPRQQQKRRRLKKFANR